MNYDEPDAELRRIPIYLEDAAGDPVSGLALAGAEVQVSLSGTAFADGDGDVTEVGSGLYYYEATQIETVTDSFIMIKIVDGAAAARPYVYSVDIGDRIVQGEETAAARRIPIYLVDSAKNPVSGLALAGPEVQLSQNGAAFADTVNDGVEIGSGAYYVELDATEVETLGIGALKVDDAAASPFVYVFSVFVPSDDDDDDDDDELEPIEAPYEPGDAEYVDHVAEALGRLVNQLARVP